MKKYLIIANWKMNPDSPGRAVILASKLDQSIRGVKNVDVVIAPPFPFLLPISAVLKRAKLGAQNMSWEDVGPFTGEVSWRQLKHIKADYVIIGHSERKMYLGETDDMINKKVRAALENGLRPVCCVGERERDEDAIPAVVGEQLVAALRGVKKQHIKRLIIAYEPIWAISTMPGAMSDTSANAHSTALYLRKVVVDLYDRKTADEMRIIYGGSVHAKNVGQFLREGMMQGALVGGASLDPKEFTDILRAAS